MTRLVSTWQVVGRKQWLVDGRATSASVRKLATGCLLLTTYHSLLSTLTIYQLLDDAPSQKE